MLSTNHDILPSQVKWCNLDCTHIWMTLECSCRYPPCICPHSQNIHQYLQPKFEFQLLEVKMNNNQNITDDNKITFTTECNSSTYARHFVLRLSVTISTFALELSREIVALSTVADGCLYVAFIDVCKEVITSFLLFIKIWKLFHHIISQGPSSTFQVQVIQDTVAVIIKIQIFIKCFCTASNNFKNHRFKFH